MNDHRYSMKVDDPRVLCISNRDFAPVVSRCLRYEFEDLIGTIDRVDVVAPTDTADPADAASPAQNAVRTLGRLAAKTRRRLAAKIDTAWPAGSALHRTSSLAADYELLFVSTQTAADLYNYSPISTWRTRAHVSICYIEELYAADVGRLGGLLDIIRQFDHVMVGVRDTVPELAKVSGRECHYLAPSTDTLLACPYPDPPRRAIDFYAMGSSRRPEVHTALRKMADGLGRYYAYDTVGNATVSSHVEHRRRLAEMIKRTQYFLVTAARWYDTERTMGQQELGLRYFEGAAGGAVLVGDVPNNASFDEYFGWPDSVIALPRDTEAIVEVIGDLDADPARIDRIRRMNVMQSLRRHDHVHRWAQILAIAGLPETVGMAERRRRLDETARLVDVAVP